jgi:hypothetical protein
MRDFFYGVGATIGCVGSVVPLWVALYYGTIRPRMLQKPMLTQKQFRQVQFFIGVSVSIPICGLLMFLVSSLDFTNPTRYSISNLFDILFVTVFTLFFCAVFVLLAIVFIGADLKRQGLVEDE